MGLDANSLENYGGFEALLERLKTRQKLSDIIGSSD